MAYETLQFGTEAGVATITLAQPEKRNAISSQMIAELLAALDETERGEARVVILTGAGKAFCAGMNLEELKALAGKSPGQNLEDSRRMAQMFHRLYAFPKPVIAAVNGPAIAGGCGLATLADFTLAVTDAKFGYTEVKIGFIPALVSVFLRRQIGEKRARDLLLSGRIFEAQEAREMGLVSEIVPADVLMARAKELRLLIDLQEAELHEELERAIRANAEIRSTVDFREGLAAFLEKREPRWTGR
jgi:methylglutaconyl-CoA hydratase